MNRGQLVARVAAKLSFADAAETTMLQDLANEGVVDVLRRTKCYVDFGELTLTQNVKDYRLSTQILAILERTIETSFSPINMLSPADMYDLRRGQNVSSPARYLAAEGNLLMVYPTPSASGEIIRFMYVPFPTPMTLDAHDPSNATYGGIAAENHRAIEYFMLWQGAEYDDKAIPQKPNEVKAMYLDEIREVRKSHRAKAGRGLSPARVGYPGTHRYPRRNDVYPG